MRSLPCPALLRHSAIAIAFAVAFAPVAHAQAQSGPPHVAYVYPAGAQQGATITIAIGGQRLRAPEDLHVVPAGGISVKAAGFERPLSAMELTQVREQLKALQERRAATRKKGADATWTPADERKFDELREKTQVLRPNQLTSQAVAETARFELTIAADAAAGPREIRFRGANGLSNPLTFHIGELPEFSEPAVHATARRDPPGTRPRAAIAVTLPAVINGQVLGGEVDRFTFEARAGQQLTFVLQARALMPYLADAVPGWFQATLAIFDEAGRELAYRDDFRFHPDPVLAYTIPADGRYTIEIKDAIFRGREDFVYRLRAGELPFITSVFPLGTAPDGTAPFALRGWNIAPDSVLTQRTEREQRLVRLAVRSRGQLSNTVGVHLGAWPAHAERERAADSAPQELALPVIVDGRIGAPGETDVFQFRGRAGERLVAEVLARRLDSPLDSRLELLDAAGRLVAESDDWEDKGAGLLTHHADSRIDATLPHDGDYRLRLRDAQHRGGNDYAYRLRVGPPQPDFELRVTPATINARAGGSVPLTVHALRRDGFDGEITLGLIEGPAGIALSGARIPPGQNQVRLTLTVASSHGREPFTLQLGGKAEIAGRTVYRVATPAEDMMQAFAYQHLVPARALVVFPAARGAGLRTAESRVELTPGGRLPVRLRASGLRPADVLHVELLDAPSGVSIAATKPVFDGVEVTLACSAEASPAAGNLVFAGSYERTSNDAKARTRRVPIGCAPAIAFEILPRTTTAAR